MGGRVWTVALENGEIAELGAEWIMPDDTELEAWAERFHLSLAEAGVDYRRREARGPGASSLEDQDAFLAAADAAFAALPADECAGLTLGTFIDALDAPGAGREAVRMRLQGTNAIDLGQVALRVVGGPEAFAAPAATYRRMTRGNQSLPDAIAGSLPDVRLGHRIRSVTHGPDDVVIDVEGDVEVRAAVVIVALPGRVAAGLHFDPRLPDDVGNALRELPMGSASKLAVSIDGSPEPRAVQSAELPFWCWVANGADGSAAMPDGVRRVGARADLARGGRRRSRSVARAVVGAEPRRDVRRRGGAEVVGARSPGGRCVRRVGQPLVGPYGGVPTHGGAAWRSRESTPPARNTTARWRARSDRACAQRCRCSRSCADGSATQADTMPARARSAGRAEPPDEWRGAP